MPDSSPAGISPNRSHSRRPAHVIPLILIGLAAIAAAMYVNIRSQGWVPDAEARVRAAQARQAQSRFDMVRQRAQAEPRSAAAQIEFARALVDREQFIAAMIPAEMAVRVEPNNAEAHLLLAMIATTLDYRGDAIAHYARAVQLNPDLLEAYQRWGGLLRAAGDTAAAETVFRKASSRSPGQAGPILSLAEVLMDRRKDSEALDLLAPLLQQPKPSVPALYMAGKACQNSYQTERAKALFRQAIAAQPDFAEALHALGSMLCNENKLSEGLPLLHKAVQLAPENPGYHYALGNGLRADRSNPGALKEAASEFERSLDIDPRSPIAHYYYGTVLEDLSEVESAAREYRRCLELDPKFGSARHRLGAALTSLGRPAEGAKYLESFAAQARGEISRVHAGRRENAFLDTADSHFQIGIERLRKGDRAGAATAFKTALARDPHHGAARRELRAMGVAAP